MGVLTRAAEALSMEIIDPVVAFADTLVYFDDATVKERMIPVVEPRNREGGRPMSLGEQLRRAVFESPNGDHVVDYNTQMIVPNDGKEFRRLAKLYYKKERDSRFGSMAMRFIDYMSTEKFQSLDNEEYAGLI